MQTKILRAQAFSENAAKPRFTAVNPCGFTLVEILVVVIILAASLYLVFYYDTRPAQRREASSEHPMTGRTARQAAGRPEASPDLELRKTEASPAAGRDAEAPAEPAAGTVSGKVTAA